MEGKPKIIRIKKVFINSRTGQRSINLPARKLHGIDAIRKVEVRLW
jgi:hypothetical protein